MADTRYQDTGTGKPMGKEKVVRQNRCDQEMNLLIFGCFFGYMALQLLVGDTQHGQLANVLNMGLYAVFVPGFLFRLGYCFWQMWTGMPVKRGKEQMLRLFVRYYLYFFVLAVAQETIQYGNSVPYSLVRVLSVVTVPSVSAVFFTLAVTALLVWVFYEKLGTAAKKPKYLVLAAGLCVGCALLRVEGESYAIIAALVGSSSMPAVPGLPYFAFFLIGMWFGKEKPGFQWRLAAGAAAGTALSLLLYGTILQDVCRITLSLLPVYLVYVGAELLSELTLRSGRVRFVCDTAEAILPVYAAAMFGLHFLAADTAGFGIRWSVVIAAGALLLIYLAILGFSVFCRVYESCARRFAASRHKTALYFVIYTGAFAVLMALCFSVFFATGNTLLWEADGVSQYYPRAAYFANYIRELFANFFSGNFELPMYDFRLGMGGEITYSLEPLYFIFALFGEDHVELAYNVITVLRFYLSGITASILFLYFKKDYFSTFIASAVYVFCGFALFGGARHTMFMIAMIMLPLLVIAIEEILRGRRWQLCTIFVAVSLFSNYYYLYMNTLGLAIYFLVRFFCQKEKEKRTFKNFMTKGLVISGSYLLGVAISCIVLVTTFGLYVGSGRSGGAVIKTPSLLFYNEQWPVRCFLSFLTTANSPGEWMKLGFLPIAFLCVVFLFTRKGRKELKVLSVITALLMLFPVTGFVFSGFSSVINRWCYLIALLVAFIVADTLADMRQMKKREIQICAGAVAVYGFLAFFGTVLITRYVKLAFIFLAVTFAVVLVGQDRVKKVSVFQKQSLMVLLTAAMVFYNGFSLFYMDDVVSEYTAPGEAKQKAEDSPLVAVKEVEDESFYRCAVPKLDYSTISSSIILDYNSVTMFNSTFNGSITEYLEQMGSTGYSVTQLLGLSNRAFMNELAAVKYYAYYDGEDGTGSPERPLPYGTQEALRTEVNGKETVVCENQYALPLGYTYDSAISREELEQYDVLERQEVMMQQVMLEDDMLAALGKTGEQDAKKKEGGKTDGPQITSRRLDFEVKAEKGINVTDHSWVAEQDKAKVKFKFESLPDSETYLVLKNAVLEGDMSEEPLNLTFKTQENKLGYSFRSDDDRYGSGQKDYVFNLGYHEDVISSCQLIMNRAGEIKFDEMILYSQPMDVLPQYAAGLTQDVLEQAEIGTNTVSGTVSLEEDKILVLSIPYQNGWTAYVDGEKTQLGRANYMYMALPLSAGEHTIELTFEIPGVKYALVIMPSAVVLFIVLNVIFYMRKKKKKRSGES
ncbi:YfhO family protein [Parablautia sp. Marseille-Q6255]|uniref:YfhO family protein n=1 Tax=Parablautia sp. Marseille-Q6255 TaxID=3039593 RepID=UPI0024BD31C9|nr:YfhO family protein [Parablautia sp. Marseille-Q6255]